MKKLLATLLATTLAFGAVVLPMTEGRVDFGGSSVITASAEDLVSGDYKYQVKTDKTVEIIGYTGKGGNVSIPGTIAGKKVTSIGENAFYECSSLTSITIPNSVTSIGEGAFSGCSSLTSITIPNGVTSIGYWAFDGCSSLTSITIPSSVTSIGYGAFNGCTSLTSVTIPNSVTSIGESAFGNCSSLISITVDSNNKNYSSKDGVLFNKNKIELIQYPIGNTRKSYTIPNSVISIGNGAFYDCTSLTSITIPNSVTSIGEYAFYGTPLLENQTTDIKYVGNWAVGCNEDIENVNIKFGTVSIADGAFQYRDIKSVTIPDSVTSIGASAFGNSTALTSITVDSNNKNYSSEDGVLFNKNKTELIQYPIGNTRKSYTIPNSVTSIGDNAFGWCSNLTSITIPNSVTSIVDYAFNYCSSLTSVTIPDSVTSIGDSAFEYCSRLKNIIIPNSVKSIGNYTFENCSSLTSITIPNSVTSIGDWAFEYCSSLTSITIPNSVTSIGDWAFEYCSSLTSITIPNSVTSIGEGAFEYCSRLKDVNYTGTKEQWNKINIDSNNYDLKSANIHYNYDPNHRHSYTSKVTKQPTCTATGIKTFTCSCGDTYTETIPKTAHNYTIKVKTVKPSLSSKGYTIYKCSCGATIKKNYVPALLNISKVKVTGLSTKTYTGKQIKPAIKVTYGKTVLKNGTDYTVKYGTNKIGKGTVTITGKGKYGGKITKSFTINPRKTPVTVKSTAKGKFTATVEKKTEATKYQIQYSTNSKFTGAKTLTTKSLKSDVKASSGKTYYVRVRTIKTVGKTNYVSGWSVVKKVKVK